MVAEFIGIAFLVTILILAGLWFIFELFRYIYSGEYELDQRLRKVTDS